MRFDECGELRKFVDDQTFETHCFKISGVVEFVNTQQLPVLKSSAGLPNNTEEFQMFSDSDDEITCAESVNESFVVSIPEPHDKLELHQRAVAQMIASGVYGLSFF